MATNTAPPRSVQDQEGRSRVAAADMEASNADLPPLTAEDAGVNEGALENTGDVDDVGHGSDPIAPAAPPQRQQLERDIVRDQIVARLRANRTAGIPATEAAEDAAEIRAFSNGGLPAEFSDGIGEEDIEDAPSIVPEQREPAPRVSKPADPPQPKLIKLVVRGQDRWVTEEEFASLAQKAAGADDYLGEARATLDEVKRIKNEIQASRAAQPGTPLGESAEHETQTPNGDEHPVDPYTEVAETLLYGDPEKAGAQLKQLLNKAVPIIATEVSTNDRQKTEHARSMQALETFSNENPDLVANPISSAAVRAALFEQQVKDLEAVGVDPAKLPKHDPNAIANIHLGFRSDPRYSGKVRTPEALLAAAKDDFSKWRNPSTRSEEPAPAAKPHQARTQQASSPRVEVNVNRNARRAAIPQQPERTAVLPSSQQGKTPPRSRSDSIAAMAAARGKAVVS